MSRPRGTPHPATTRLPAERCYVLRALQRPSTHDGYAFVDEEHAILWLSQPWVGDTAYAVEIVRVTYRDRRCPHCGGVMEQDRVVERTLRPSTFLAWARTEEETP